MIQRLRILYTIVAGLTTLPVLVAQKYSNEFLAIGAGARAHGMGHAVVASVKDPTAAIWNPAGLADPDAAESPQIAAMHAEWFAGVGKFDFMSVALPGKRPATALGISLIRFGIDEIPNTLSLYESDGTVNFDNIREFSAADYALFMSYARRIERTRGAWLLGGSAKIVHRRIGPFANAWGFGMDIGAQYHRQSWRFGVLARDLTNTFNAWSFHFSEADKQTLQLTNNEIPINSLEITRPQLLLGIAKSFKLSPRWTLLPEIDCTIHTDGPRNVLLSGDPFSLDPGIGLEAALRDVLFLRAGMRQFQYQTGFSAKEVLSPTPGIGIGLRFGNLFVDYAFTNLSAQQHAYSHIVSLALKVKQKKTTL